MFGEWRRIFHIITIVSKLAGEWRRNLHKGDMTRFPFLYGFYDGFFSRVLKKEKICQPSVPPSFIRNSFFKYDVTVDLFAVLFVEVPLIK